MTQNNLNLIQDNLKSQSLTLKLTQPVDISTFEIQWMPLNGLTLGQTITDPINQMITISDEL